MLGFLAFGHGEKSQYLFVEIAPPVLASTIPLMIKIDSHVLPNGELPCAAGWPCSTSIEVDDGLLTRSNTKCF